MHASKWLDLPIFCDFKERLGGITDVVRAGIAGTVGGCCKYLPVVDTH